MKRKSNKLFYSLSLKSGICFQTIVFAIAILLAGCQKEKDFTTGSVTGFVKTMDKYAQFQEDNSGVKVTSGNCSTYTNSLGKYRLTNVPIGTHSIKYTKDGYSSDSCLITITPGGIPVFNSKSIFLSEKPDVKITSLGISIVKDKLILKGTLSQTYSVARFFVYINNSSEVSYNNYNLEASDLFFYNFEDNYYDGVADLTYKGDFEKEYYITGITDYISNNPTYLAIYITNPFYNHKKENSLIPAWPVTKVN